MSFRRIVFLVLLIGILSSCSGKIEYFYFDVADAGVAEADWKKPDIWSYIGDKVPIKTTIDWNGEIVDFLNVKGCCVPRITILSPVALSNVIVTGTAYDGDGNRQDFEEDFGDLLGCVHNNLNQIDENIIKLSWSYTSESFVAKHGLSSCIRIGDEITIKLVPENGSAPLTINAVLVHSGYYWKGIGP